MCTLVKDSVFSELSLVLCKAVL